MATKVVMEALSPTMEEGRLVEWKKGEGESVAVGDVLAEVETDKAVMELVARAGGTLLKQVVPAGTTVPVSQLVALIGEPGEQVPADGNGRDGGAKAKKAPVEETKPAAQPTSPAPAPATVPTTPVSTERVKASPLARRIATERGIDLGALHGSGPEGRVVLRDLEGAGAVATTPAGAPRPVIRGGGGPAYTDTPLTQIRKTIAKRLAQSLGPIPTFYLTTEVDMERIWDAREALKGLGDGPKVSFNDIIIKCVASALRQHPSCNAWWQDDHIRYWNEVHVSMAVAVEEGLITPVIRHADQKTLREIAGESHDLAARARERRLKPEEYTGGTFSVSNLGMLGIDDFTAIINPPEAGILAVGRIVQVPVARDGQVVVRRRMRVTMSCDHRVIDGATGARFLQTLTAMLENPLAMVY
ncbi:MAG TPA: dihydrolipoamide acetyltransferase family protein [Gemmatimonadales bacterium]|jgi:pyruvate dehydrogenase E2 component (dihydrolipoamide acetyltransferase)